MKKEEIIRQLNDIEGNPDIELLIQTTINADYYNIFTKNIITIEESNNSIIIRGHEK